MLIEKFNIFEKVSEANSSEHAKELLLSEGIVSEGIVDTVKNYFSRLLGGKVKKLDSILERYKNNEDKYWDNWIKARNKYYEAELMSSELRSSQREKYEELKGRAEKYGKQVEDTRKDVNSALEKQAKIITKDNQRLLDYWEYNKAVMDEQIARNTLEAAKRNLSDKQELDNIHKRLEVLKKEATRAGDDFSQKYGKDFDFNNVSDDDVETTSGMSIDKLRTMSPANLTELRKSIEGRLKRLKDNYADKISDMKRESDSRSKSDPDFEYHEKDMRHKTQEAYTRFSRERDAMKKQIETIDDIITSMKLGTDNIKQSLKSDPDMVTQTGKEEIGKEGIDSAATDAISQTSQSTKPTQGAVESVIDKDVAAFFESKKEMIERSIGGTIEDGAYKHIINDLVNLFGKLTLYYKSTKKDYYSQVLGVSMVSFAGNIYKYKKSKGEINKDLTNKELDDKLKEFQDYENK